MPGNFADMVMPGNVSLVLHRIGSGAAPNWSLESVQAPGQLVDTKKARVIAVVAGHGTPAASKTVSLVVNGKVIATKKVDVPADGRATVAFDGLDVPYGESKCSVKVDGADAFSADDVNYFAVKRADPERVLFVHQASDARSPLYFGTALGAAAQASFVLQPITPEQATDIDPTKYAFVVLSDVPAVPSVLENVLIRYVEAGGSVLVAEGMSAAHREHIPVFGGTVEDGHFYARSGNAGFEGAGEMDASHPALKDASGWQGAKFFYASSVSAENARVVAKLADGTPLVLDKQMGEGHVLLFASGFDNVTNDLPLNPTFVAFVDEAARYLAGEERMGGARLVDSYVQLRNPVNVQVVGQSKTAVDVIAPDGSRPMSLREAAVVQSFQLTRAGFYQVKFANGRDALLAVNADPRESDLRPVADDVLKLWTGATVAQSGTANAVSPELQQGTSHLWWWIMLLVAITAVAETAVASGYLGTEREAL